MVDALGQARSWTDHLLWHHAAHTVDLFAYQTSREIVQANANQGPPSGAGDRHGHVDSAQNLHGGICTLSLSFNNDGPLRGRERSGSGTPATTSGAYGLTRMAARLWQA